MVLSLYNIALLQTQQCHLMKLYRESKAALLHHAKYKQQERTKRKFIPAQDDVMQLNTDDIAGRFIHS